MVCSIVKAERFKGADRGLTECAKARGRCKMKTETREKCIEAMDFMKDWDQWRGTLKQAIESGRQVGLTDAEIQSLATNVGDFLSTKVCPATKEEELLRDMWSVASADERKALGSLIFKMVE